MKRNTRKKDFKAEKKRMMMNPKKTTIYKERAKKKKKNGLNGKKTTRVFLSLSSLSPKISLYFLYFEIDWTPKGGGGGESG